MLEYIIEKHFSKASSPKANKDDPKSSEIMAIPNLYRYKLLVIFYHLGDIEPILENYHPYLNISYRFLD